MSLVQRLTARGRSSKQEKETTERRIRCYVFMWKSGKLSVVQKLSLRVGFFLYKIAQSSI